MKEEMTMFMHPRPKKRWAGTNRGLIGTGAMKQHKPKKQQQGAEQ